MAKSLPFKKKKKKWGYLHFSGPQNNLALGILTSPGYAANTSNVGLKELDWLLLFSRWVVFDPMNCSTPGFPILPYSPWVCSDSRQWCQPTISSSVALFSSPQSFPVKAFTIPASQSLPMSGLFPSGGQSIGALADWLEGRRNTGWGGGVFPRSIPAPLPVYEGTKSHQ